MDSEQLALEDRAKSAKIDRDVSRIAERLGARLKD